MAIAIPQLKFPQIKGPAWLQFGLFFGFSLLLSLLLFALFARPLVWRTRGEYSLFLANVAQSLRGGPAAFEEIIPSMNRFGVESWILDLQGRTLASSHHRPLPLDWDLLEKRMDFREIFPFLFALSQKVPFSQRDCSLKESSLKTWYHSSFHHLLVPRIKERGSSLFQEAFWKIRSLFFLEKENRYCILREALHPCGRMLNIQTKIDL